MLGAMKMTKRLVTAGELKIGDIIDNYFTWRVVGLVGDKDYRGFDVINFHLEWTGHGPDPKTNVALYTYYPYSQLVCVELKPLPCHPCRDSDCDCIFNEID